MHLFQPKHQLINKTSYLGLSGHVSLLCPGVLHIPHPRGGRVRGCKGGEDCLGWGGAGAIRAPTGASISSEASETERPPSWGICLLDHVRFCFCFSLAVRKLLTSFSRIAAVCIPFWHALRI